MSEETKLAKFEVILKEVKEWFDKPISSNSTANAMVSISAGIRAALRATNSVCGQNGTTDNYCFRFGDISYHPSFLDDYTSNPNIGVWQRIAADDYPVNSSNVVTDVVELIKAYKTPDELFGEIQTKPRNCMIFWMLFLGALDDEIYNNELDSIIDIAYCMDFNEAMIRDWCHAVEYIIQGNRFSENCNLECETEEGKAFFLHQGK